MAEAVEAVTVRPGDTLIVRVDPGIRPEMIAEFKARVGEHLPGVEMLVIGAEQILVYRPEGDTAP